MGSPPEGELFSSSAEPECPCLQGFQPEPFWVVRPHLKKAGQPLDLEWERGRLFDVGIAQLFQKVVLDGRHARVRLGPR